MIAFPCWCGKGLIKNYILKRKSGCFLTRGFNHCFLFIVQAEQSKKKKVSLLLFMVLIQKKNMVFVKRTGTLVKFQTMTGCSVQSIVPSKIVVFLVYSFRTTSKSVCHD